MAKQRRKIDVWSAIIIFSLLVLDLILWRGILKSGVAGGSARLYFFDVMQGSSELLILPGNIKIMVDAGGDDKIVQDLDAALPSRNDNYINLAIISYPYVNNYRGYEYLLDHYAFGAFIYDGRNDIAYTKEWAQFLAALNAKHIPLITVAKGDSVQYGDNSINFLSPDTDLAQSADLTDAALVEQIKTLAFTALLASDIGDEPGKLLLNETTSIGANILKAPFPLLGGSSTRDFLYGTDPKVIVVAPGTKNTASAPSKAIISALASSTKAILLQTAVNATIMIAGSAGKLQILKGK